MKIAALILSVALLAGCDTPAKIQAAGAGLVDAGINYGNVIIAKRQEARYECIRLRSQMARDLEAEGKLEEAMQAWTVLHRDLSIIKAIQDRDAGAILAGLNEAWPCEVGAQ